MSFGEGRSVGADIIIKSRVTKSENPLGGKPGDASWHASVDLKNEERLQYAAAQAGRERSYLDKYWVQANQKGIFRGEVYTIKGEKFKISGIELRGGKHPIVILHGGKSGFEPKEIRLDDPFWEDNSEVKKENTGTENEE